MLDGKFTARQQLQWVGGGGCNIPRENIVFQIQGDFKGVQEMIMLEQKIFMDV